MEITKNFNRKEFDCKDGKTVPIHLMGNLKELCDNLEILREYVDSPINITSGYRTKEYNEKIGGVPNSQHLLAKAADIKVIGWRPKEIYNIITYLMNNKIMKKGMVIKYKNFIHYDTRNIKN